MTEYPQLIGLACPYCGCSEGRRRATPVRVNRKRIVVQSFDFTCGNSASCTKQMPEITASKRCDVTLAKAINGRLKAGAA